MKRLAVILGGLALLAIVVLMATRPTGLPENALPDQTVDLANGEMLFHAGGCVSCHASADADSEPPVLGGGLALDTPFGTFRAPNISPDPDNGIGAWSTLDLRK